MVMLMKWKWTALMYAAVQGDEKISDLLIKHHADLMKKDGVNFI